MLDVVSRVAGVVLAVLIASCFSTAPVQAAPCKHSWPDEECATPKKAAKAPKKATRAKPIREKRVASPRQQPRPQRSVQAACRRCKPPQSKWHGWSEDSSGAAVYHDGQRYAGGNPRGPALWYNNYEGGFNPAVYWKLMDRQGP
jgi:hypothetical protein